MIYSHQNIGEYDFQNMIYSHVPWIYSIAGGFQNMIYSHQSIVVEIYFRIAGDLEYDLQPSEHIEHRGGFQNMIYHQNIVGFQNMIYSHQQGDFRI